MAAAIACEACGKKFAWSPQFAGKKMKCKCGSAIAIPADAPAAAKPAPPPVKASAPAAVKSSSRAESSRSAPPLPSKKKSPPPPVPIDEPIIEVASHDEPVIDIIEPVVAMGGGGAAVLACPSCNSALTPGAILCVGCGYNLQLRRKMIAAPTKIVADDRPLSDGDLDTGYMIREKIAPPALLVLGFLLWVAFRAAGWEAESDIALAGIAITVAIMIGFATVFMTGGCFVAAKLLDTNFGSLPTAVVKLAATYAMANGVTEMCTYAMGGFGQFMIYTSVGYGIYWIMLMWLFELDGFEVWVTASIFFLLQIGAFFAFMLILLNIGFGGMAAGMGGGGGMPIGGGGGSEYEMYDEDYEGDMMYEDGQFMAPDDPDAPQSLETLPPGEGVQDPGAAPAEPVSPDAAEPAPTDGMSDATRAWPWAAQVQECLASRSLWDMRMWDPAMDSLRYRLRVVIA